MHTYSKYRDRDIYTDTHTNGKNMEQQQYKEFLPIWLLLFFFLRCQKWISFLTLKSLIIKNHAGESSPRLITKKIQQMLGKNECEFCSNPASQRCLVFFFKTVISGFSDNKEEVFKSSKDFCFFKSSTKFWLTLFNQKQLVQQILSSFLSLQK